MGSGSMTVHRPIRGNNHLELGLGFLIPNGLMFPTP